MVELETKGIKEAQRKLLQLRQAVSQGRVGPMKETVELAKSIIIERTAKGIDWNHKPFKPYSTRYAKKKKSKPNLRVSDDMLDAIRTQAWAKKGRVYVKAGLQWVKMKVHAAGGRSGSGTGFSMPQRNPMGLHSTEVTRCRKEHREWWEKYVKGLGL